MFHAFCFFHSRHNHRHQPHHHHHSRHHNHNHHHQYRKDRPTRVEPTRTVPVSSKFNNTQLQPQIIRRELNNMYICVYRIQRVYLLEGPKAQSKWKRGSIHEITYIYYVRCESALYRPNRFTRIIYVVYDIELQKFSSLSQILQIYVRLRVTIIKYSNIQNCQKTSFVCFSLRNHNSNRQTSCAGQSPLQL